ncbi:MAG: hydroxymethylglutaryl-CoA synthase [Methanophagales archaeon]|nr:hydroxymethylglutaryl-CoA synthase [Methanophagales archaeon]MCW3137195.1 hydroxymethylglutaryl-CoA synthase [Methanophagales archaeon]MCW3140084.1 hydroxymethylglutaryl-CoA synthase [Methanophagales archaeon]MCW7070147.1 hydroxymethylglutaryl-CoA synthase [Methanophagales archaeon]MCW7073808.1 hydroxymethylglutaryl-CoA synthase [Methanophagales archaeon]
MTGIVSYGVYVPSYRIRVEEIAKQWGENPDIIKSGLLVEEKSVPDMDEDTATMAVEASRAAILRASLDPGEIGAIYVGSESHPYAVKPTATIVGAAIGASNSITAADFEFACKAGTAAIQTCIGLVALKKIKYGLAIGADVSQSSPGDALEYTAGAGSAAFVIGDDGVIAEIEDFTSFTSDTPDFWRRDLQKYPSHGGRFTGEPAYFRHIISATKELMDKTGLQPADFDYAVFHQPNGKFPLKAAKSLGFNSKQLKPGLIVTHIGNTYSASSLIGLSAVLDNALPGQRILMTSFGSGAGSDSFALTVTDGIDEVRDKAPRVEDFLSGCKYIDYAGYVKHQGKIRL